MIAGMDFGTTHSGMAIYDGQQLHTIPLNALDANDRIIPTILYVTNEQKITFGREAMNTYFEQNLGRPSKMEKVWVGEITQTFAELPTFVKDVYIWVDVLSPGRLFLSFKTDLSDISYTGTAIGRFFYTLEHIAAAYLYIAKRRAERFLGSELDEIVLGRPVKFNNNPEADAYAQARLLDAALQAGYKRVYFEYEPVAAAYYYEMSITRPENVLIFDFGGGTLDITVMRLGEKRGEKVLATGGVPIAGDVFDRKIVRAKLPKLFGEGSLYRSLDKKLPVPGWIYDAFNDWRTLLTLQQPEHLQTLRTIAPVAEKRRNIEALISLVTSNYSLKLFEVVEKVKRRLSEHDEAVIGLQGNGFVIREPITRVEFETLIRPEYNIIERHLNETLNISGLRAGEIDVVIRTGGSSQIPMFQRLLAQTFGEEKVKSIDTFGSVTAGLGVIAHRVGRGEIDKRAYTASTKIHIELGDGRTHIPPINLDLLKQQIIWQEGASAGGSVALTLLSKGYELILIEQPASLLQQHKTLTLAELGLDPNTAVQSALCTPLDEPLLLLTSSYRFLLMTGRELIHQRATGMELTRLHGFERGEQLCHLCRWTEMRDQDQLILVSTQGYARRFEMAQIRPLIEGPTPAKLDWALPGWPRAVVGASGGQFLVLINNVGRAVRLPIEAVRRTGTRAFHKAKSDEIIGGYAVQADDRLWLLSSEGYAKWLGIDQVPLTAEGGPGTAVVRRRGGLCGTLAQVDRPVWVITSTRLVTLDAGATPQAIGDVQGMQQVLKLNKGERVVGVIGMT